MQQQRSTIESVPENVDIDLGSFPLTDGMNRQAYLSNRIIQEGACSSSCMPSSESSSSLRAVGSGDESFNAWNFGQPSFVVNREGRSNFDGMDWYPSISSSTGGGPSSAARQFEMHHNVLFPETAVAQNPNANLVHHGPSISRFLNLESEDGTCTGAQFGNSMHLSGSSSHIDGRTGGSSTSLATWGTSSSKRKALEGTSGQSNPSASSGGIPQAENFAWPNATPHGNIPDPMNLSPSTSWNSPSANFLEHLTPSTGCNVREAALESSPPLSITMSMGTAAAPRSFERRGSLWPQQEPFPFNLSSSAISSLGNSRHHSGFSLSDRPGFSSNFLNARSTRSALANAGVSQASQSSAIQVPQLPRNTPGFPWIGVQHLSDNLTGSFLPGGSSDGANSGSMLRYVSDTPVVSSADETRNMGQDPPSWDLAAGLTGHSHSSLPSSRRINQNSSGHPLLPPFINPRPMSPEIQRSLELAPWAPESFDGQNSQNSHLPAPPPPSGCSASPQGSGGNLLGHRRPYHMPGYSTDRQGDELLAMSASPLRAFASDIEGRNRIRQVLNAMRRGENLRDEDYMLFEPLMFQGLAEIHDRHRDMRLDVDNMSYEELLELEEQIGDVSTGLKEETILKFLKQHKKQTCTGAESVKDLEPCCICQEPQYEDGEEIGELDCGHDFHVNCIKQWLTHKNLCPICKTTGLVT